MPRGREPRGIIKLSLVDGFTRHCFIFFDLNESSVLHYVNFSVLLGFALSTLAYHSIHHVCMVNIIKNLVKWHGDMPVVPCGMQRWRLCVHRGPAAVAFVP